jgi:hypothetical protein
VTNYAQPRSCLPQIVRGDGRDRQTAHAVVLAICEGIPIREASKELGRRAGKASFAKRKQKQLSIQPTLPVVNTEAARKSNPRRRIRK